MYGWGESGAGKTHVAKALAEACGSRTARYCDAARYDPAAAGGDVLILDDVERLADSQQVALFNAFNERAFSFLLVTAAAAPRDVALRRDLATRLATGLTYRILPLSDEEKHAALAAHARVRGFELGEEVARYLLNHARRDMGSLVSALDALDRYSLETGRTITVPLLKAALDSTLAPALAQGRGRPL
jgi:DnaA family protein